MYDKKRKLHRFHEFLLVEFRYSVFKRERNLSNVYNLIGIMRKVHRPTKTEEKSVSGSKKWKRKSKKVQNEET